MSRSPRSCYKGAVATTGTTRGSSAPDEGLRRNSGTAWRRRIRALALILFVSGAATSIGYRDQIWSVLTHRKGAPSHTEPYVAFPATPRPWLRLAVAGDVGNSGTRLDATADRMSKIAEESAYDALLLLGDNVYPDGDPDRLPETVFEPFAGVLDRGAELLAVLGNHDVRAGHGDAQRSALGMPGRWWSQDLGQVLVVGIDSNEPGNAQQLEFLEDSLARSDEEWKIVALHHPPYSAGRHGSSEEVRRAFAHLFERYGVQLVLSGHDHDYQRSKPINGVTYVVSGAASGTRRTGEASFTAVSWSWHHFLDVTVFADRLVLRAVNQDGLVADEAEIAP